MSTLFSKTYNMLRVSSSFIVNSFSLNKASIVYLLCMCYQLLYFTPPFFSLSLNCKTLLLSSHSHILTTQWFLCYMLLSCMPLVHCLSFVLYIHIDNPAYHCRHYAYSSFPICPLHISAIVFVLFTILTCQMMVR